MVYESIRQLLQTPDPAWVGFCRTRPNFKGLNPNPKMNILCPNLTGAHIAKPEADPELNNIAHI